MKGWMKAALAVVVTGMLAGCASDYVIATKKGEMLLTQGKPKLDEETGMIGYVDEEGRQKQINKDDVSQIIER